MKEAVRKYATPKTLKIGKTYVHHNYGCFRTITGFDERGVFYVNSLGHGGYCSTAHFCKTCRYEAKPEEKECIEKSSKENLDYIKENYNF